MKVICKANRGHALKKEHFDIGFTESSRFNMTTGNIYHVYAMAMWRAVLVVLIVDDYGGDSRAWYPLELFDISDPCLDSTWKFCVIDIDDTEVKALWGYPSLIDDSEHYDALIELEPDAIKLFSMEVKRVAALESEEDSID